MTAIFIVRVLVVILLSVGFGAAHGDEVRIVDSESPEVRRLHVQPRLQLDSHTLIVDVTNSGNGPVQVVRPRAKLIAQNGQWAGWNVRVTVLGRRYLPVPPPGPSVPATSADMITLEVHESFSTEIDLSRWRKSVPGLPLMSSPFLSEESSPVNARIRWSMPPVYLGIENSAPPVAAWVER